MRVPVCFATLFFLSFAACPVWAQHQSPVRCFVFDDGYTNMAGPSTAIYISGAQGGKACIPDGTTNGTCRKWFGRCTTGDGEPVFFYVFDDQRGDTQRGPVDAVYIPSGGNQACIPDGTTKGTCRKWFGEGFGGTDGVAVACSLFNDGNSNVTTPSDAIYIPPMSSTPGAGSACIPDGTSMGTCRKWFGDCFTQVGEPVTYTLVINGSNGFPSGSLGGVAFPPTGDNASLTFTFTSTAASVVPFFAPCTGGCPGFTNGVGFLNFAGAASVAIQDTTTGNTQQTVFAPQAGIFVSADNGNHGAGFGSGIIPPQTPGFPGQPVYPYALFTNVTLTSDLKTPFNSGTSPAGSIVGFGGAPGGSPIPLPTRAGALIINNDTQANPQPTGVFTVTTAGYNLSVAPFNPPTVAPGTTATTQVTFSSFGNYTGNVTIQCQQSTLGLQSASCNRSILNASSPSATLTVTTGGVANGTYSVVVTGVDDNVQGPTGQGQSASNGPQFAVLGVTNTVTGTTGGGAVAVLTFLALLALWHAARFCWRRRRMSA